MEDNIVAAAQRQIEAIEACAHNSEAFSEAEAVELVRWFSWRTQRLVETDLCALRGLLAHEQTPGEPFAARWQDIAHAGDAAYSRLGTSFHRLEHIGIVERLGRDRHGVSLWRIRRSVLEAAA